MDADIVLNVAKKRETSFVAVARSAIAVTVRVCAVRDALRGDSFQRILRRLFWLVVSSRRI